MGKREEFGFTLDRLKAIEPTDKRRFIYDTKIDGLRVQITPKGATTFQFYKWVKDHGPVTFTIGRFNKKTLDKQTLDAAIDSARKHAAGVIELGADYIAKLQEKKTEETFESFFYAWLGDRKEQGEKKMRDVEGRYKHHVAPTFGNRKPSSITTGQLKKWRTLLLKKKKVHGHGTLSRTTINRCTEIVRAVLNANSLDACSKVPKFQEHSRDRYLTGDELAKLFAALETTDKDMRDLVLLALTTGGRKGNLLSMSWKEIDLETGVWRIPSSKSKNSEPLDIPLIAEARDILVSRQNTRRSISAYVFPAKTKTGHFPEPHRRWKALLESAGIDTTIRFHDLRRTMGSYQAMSGASLPIIGKSLGHSDPKATEIYARIRDANPVRDAMSTGFGAMLKASKKVVNIGGKD